MDLCIEMAHAAKVNTSASVSRRSGAELAGYPLGPGEDARTEPGARRLSVV